jgi:Glycosyl transferase family 2
MNRYDLAVAYRIYPRVARSAVGLPYSESKLRLSEICLRSFKNSLGNLRVKLWVLLDGCPDGYSDLFRRYFDDQDLTLLPLSGVGNHGTFGKQIHILLEQEQSDLVYFAEDDYVYRPGQFPRMVEFLQNQKDAHFVTPYDHLDCYTLDIHRHPKWVRAYGGHHWRTAASTCLTFLTRKQTLRRKRRIFQSYCWRNDDCSLWLSLTKTSLFNPAQFVRFAFRERHFAKVIAKGWLYGWPQILFGEQMRLWAPIPGIATHLDVRALSPTIDWRTLMRLEADAIGFEPLPGTGKSRDVENCVMQARWE